jgi:hypothetical protein
MSSEKNERKLAPTFIYCKQQLNLLNHKDYANRLKNHPVWGDKPLFEEDRHHQQQQQQHQQQQQQKQQQQQQQVENINPQVMDSTNLGKRNIRED